MTRLAAALSRAQELQKKPSGAIPSGDVVPSGDVEGAEPTTLNVSDAGADVEPSEQAVAPLAASVDRMETRYPESAEPLLPASIQCPSCHRVEAERTGLDGFWEASVLSLFKLHPYQCRSCRHRFRRFGANDGDPSARDGAAKAFSTFLPPGDNRDFAELIRDIAHAERDMQQTNREMDFYPAERKSNARDYRQRRAGQSG